MPRHRPLIPPQRWARRAVLLAATTCLSIACSHSPMAPTTPMLKVGSIAPSMGSTTGGTVVTVMGAEFSSGATLTVGGVPATNVTIQSPSTLTAVIGPRAAAGAGDVVVTSAGKSASLAGGFAFVAPTGSNQPPVVASIRSVGSRANQPSGFADLDEIITLVANASDVETPVSPLTYEWTGPGTFSGAGASTSWRLPATLSSTPAQLTVMLLVTETFTEGPVTHRQKASGSFVVQAHDSRKEVLDMGEDFLTLFSRSEVPTAEVLHNFSATCDSGRGRADEKSDVDNNRATYVQDFGAFRIARRTPFSVNFRGSCFTSDFRVQPNTDACFSFAVHWEVTKKSTGAREITDGVDYVSAVVENNQWKLCHSSFVGTVNYPALGVTRAVSW